MSDVVDLHGQPLPLEDNHEFISDFARYSEGILDEKFLRRKYRFDNATWEQLGNNDALVERIENEKLRRVRDGSSKRERAQKLVAQAPGVLGDIMLDGNASPKHRIDASKTLDAFAVNGPEATAAADRFIITINLGSDVERYNKSIAINPNDVDPNDTPTDIAPRGLIASTTAKKKDGGDGEPI